MNKFGVTDALFFFKNKVACQKTREDFTHGYFIAPR